MQNQRNQKSPSSRYRKIRALLTATMREYPTHRQQTRQEEIHRQSPPLYRNWVAYSIYFYLGGLLIFHAEAIFGTKQWDTAYYVWDKTKDLIFLYTLYKYVPMFRMIVVPAMLYSTLRACMQIADIAIQQGQNTLYIVSVLFLTAFIATAFITLKSLHHEWKQL